MGNSKRPHQDDQDDDGIPDEAQVQGQGQVDTSQELDRDAVPDGTDVSSNPIIINR